MVLRRYPRLMLPAVVSCCLAYFLFIWVDLDRSALAVWIQQYGDFQSTFKGAIYSGAIISFAAYSYSPYNPMLWTMFIELLGSMVIYMLCWNKWVLRVPFLALITGMVMLVLIVTETVRLSVEFGILALLGGYGFSQVRVELKQRAAWLYLVLGLYLTGAHWGSVSYAWLYHMLGVYTDLLCHFVAGCLLVYAVIFNRYFNALLSTRMVVLMGKVSFSVYLLHMMLISTVGAIVFNVFSTWFMYSAAALVACISVIVSVYLLGIVFYYGGRCTGDAY